MSFTMSCPNCSLVLSVGEGDVGRQGKCSRCGAVFTIEMAGEVASPVPAPAALWPEVTPGVILVSNGISRGFSVLHSNLWTFVLIALCFIGISFAIGLLGQIPCLGLLLAVANGLLLQPALTCGFYRASLKQHDGIQADVGDLFAEFNQWVDILLLSLAFFGLAMLVAIPGLIVGGIGLLPMLLAAIRNQPPPQPNVPILVAGGMLLVLSLIIVSLGLMFAYPALVDRRRGVGDAMRTSWQLMTSNPMGAIGGVLFAGLINLLGILACCVGVLYTMPAIYCIFGAIYRTGMPQSHGWDFMQVPGGPLPSMPAAGPASPLPQAPPTPPPPGSA